MCRYEFRKLLNLYIESHWAACKGTLKRLFVVHCQYLTDYLDEQMWRSRHPHSSIIIFHHIIPQSRSQDFTMEGVHKRWMRNFLKVVKPGGLRDRSPQWGPGQSPDRRYGEQSPEAEATWKISVLFLTFSCTKSSDSLFCCKHTSKKN